MSKKAVLKTVEIQKGKKTKVVKIRHHHHKPYRKAHLGSLLILAILGFALLLFGISYKEKMIAGVESAKEFIENLLSDGKSPIDTVKSTYGFRISYDSSKFFGSAIDSTTGNLYVSKELASERPYQTVKLSADSNGKSENEPTLTINYYQDEKPAKDLDKQLEEKERNLAESGLDLERAELERVSSGITKIDKVEFRQAEWVLAPKSPLLSSLTATYITYVGFVNNRLLTIKIYSGISGQPELNPFTDVIKSIKFGVTTEGYVFQTEKVKKDVAASQRFIETLTFAGIAHAAEKTEVSELEKNSAIYSPAVVKIYNIYCLNISLKGSPYLRDVCDGVTGTGFFVSSDGYVATNGHVATASPKDLVIYHALYNSAKGNTRYLLYLAQIANLRESDFVGLKEPKELAAKIIDKFYALPDSYFTTTNSKVNLLVSLNEATPDLKELASLTIKRKGFNETNSIRNAKLFASDYRMLDGINGFKASDVAILKINRNKLPVTKLGNIEGLTQGDSLAIIGFPGSAGDNGLVESTQSKSTLTTGKVSAIKNVSGSSKKLIETDATIGSGNSGGPALNENGEVVGLATYTVDRSGSGGGVFNYIRDIKDLKDLASKESITFDTESETQKEWEKGIGYFYNARYSKALKSFDKVRSYYPEHPKVAELSSAAQTRIDAGQDVKDFPIIPVAIGGVLLIAGIVTMIILMVRHRKTHELYKEHFGDIPPQAGGFGNPQISSYSANSPQASPASPGTPPMNLSGFQSGPSSNNPFVPQAGNEGPIPSSSIANTPQAPAQPIPSPAPAVTPRIINDHSISVDGIKKTETGEPNSTTNNS